MLLYKITQKISRKAYIGITTETIKCRMSGHQFRARTGWKSRFYSAVRKYGWSMFEVEILAETTEWSQLLVLEQAAIAEHKTMQPAFGYNMTAGGEGTLGWDPPKAWRLAASRRAKGVTPSAATRAKLSAATAGKNNPRYGAKWTAETRKKIMTNQRAAYDEGRGRQKPAGHGVKVSKGLKAALRTKKPKHLRSIMFRGQTKLLVEWAELMGLSDNTVSKRLVTYKWSVDRALTTPAVRSLKLITHNKITDSISGWARRAGLRISTLSLRLRRGLSMEQALLPV